MKWMIGNLIANLILGGRDGPLERAGRGGMDDRHDRYSRPAGAYRTSTPLRFVMMVALAVVVIIAMGNMF